MYRNIAIGCVLCALISGDALGQTPKPFLVGGDISMLTRQEEAGAVFKNSQGAKDCIALMTASGCNCFRLRLFVNPTGKGGGVQDVPYTITLAKRIKAAKGVFLLDFHYSDTWADPSHQSKPAAWKDLPFEELVRTVESYTAEVIAEFKTQEVLPDMVQIGNEIHPGFLWPDGKLGGPDSDQVWMQFAQLLNAGISGVRSATTPDDNIKIIIHIACGGDFAKTDWFFSNLQKHNVSYDIIGQSFYPWWHGTMKELEDNLAKTAAKFKKDIVVVETAYPNREVKNFETRADHRDAMVWPMSHDGQSAFLEELVRTVRETPDNHGLGVLWWYPESVPTARPGGWYGGAMALFDTDGTALPAMQCFTSE